MQSTTLELFKRPQHLYNWSHCACRYPINCWMCAYCYAFLDLFANPYEYVSSERFLKIFLVVPRL